MIPLHGSYDFYYLFLDVNRFLGVKRQKVSAKDISGGRSVWPEQH